MVAYVQIFSVTTITGGLEIDVNYLLIAIFVATHVFIQIQLQKHSSSFRMNRATGGAVFEGSFIRYNISALKR